MDEEKKEAMEEQTIEELKGPAIVPNEPGGNAVEELLEIPDPFHVDCDDPQHIPSAMRLLRCPTCEGTGEELNLPQLLRHLLERIEMLEGLNSASKFINANLQERVASLETDVLALQCKTK